MNDLTVPFDTDPPSLRLWHETEPLPVIVGVMAELRWRRTINGYQAYVVETTRTGGIKSMKVLRYVTQHGLLPHYKWGKPVRGYDGVGDLIERIQIGVQIGTINMWKPK